jgi:tripartite-type tricarboxylate transporter receptor subunit TctC
MRDEGKSALKATAAAIAMLLCVGSTTWAESPYPNRLVRIVVPFGPGSVSDGLARITANKLGALWNQQVIVENHPGLPGTTSVAKAAPDGYTLMITSNGHAITGIINKGIQFDPIKDFAGVEKLASSPQVALVPPGLPVKTLADFIALAKRQPGKLNFSSAGIASTSYLCAELLKQAAKIDIVHVPYKGPEAGLAVMRGDAQFYLAPFHVGKELAAAGKVRAIAVNASARTPYFPGLPTVAETLPGYACDSWSALMVPAGTPRPIIDKLHDDFAAVLKMPDVIERLPAMGAIPVSSTPEQVDAQMKYEMEFYAKVLGAAGVGAK